MTVCHSTYAQPISKVDKTSWVLAKVPGICRYHIRSCVFMMLHIIMNININYLICF